MPGSATGCAGVRAAPDLVRAASTRRGRRGPRLDRHWCWLASRFGDLVDECSSERGRVGERDHVAGILDELVLGSGQVMQDQLAEGVVDNGGG